MNKILIEVLAARGICFKIYFVKHYRSFKWIIEKIVENLIMN